MRIQMFSFLPFRQKVKISAGWVFEGRGVRVAFLGITRRWSFHGAGWVWRPGAFSCGTHGFFARHPSSQPVFPAGRATGLRPLGL